MPMQSRRVWEILPTSSGFVLFCVVTLAHGGWSSPSWCERDDAVRRRIVKDFFELKRRNRIYIFHIFLLITVVFSLFPAGEQRFPLALAYSLKKTEWNCSLLKEWMTKKSEFRVDFEWICVIFTHFGVTSGITRGFRVIPEVTPK